MSQGIDEFKAMLPAAMNFKVTPVEIKEIVYQSVDYLGIGRVLPFLDAVNDILAAQGITLPLENQATTTMENRLEKGIQSQVDIFGDGMKDFYKSGAEESRHINRWLASNCFGDFYTRKGLGYKTRELITFCFLYAQGGCEPQLTSHAAANMRLGNDKKFLINVISQCLPFIGYPRTLNALLGIMMLCMTIALSMAGCGGIGAGQAESSTEQKEVVMNMKLLIDEMTYEVQLDDNETTRDIVANMPLDLSMVKYAGHEYYAELPFTPVFDQTRTSDIKAGHVYYWDGWNAFVINYEDYDIAPYKVVHIGKIKDAEISSYLQNADENIMIKITE